MQIHDHQNSKHPRPHKDFNFLMEREKFCRNIRTIEQISERNLRVQCELQELYVKVAARKQEVGSLHAKINATTLQVGLKTNS